MLASELIQQLQVLIEKHGDKEVIYQNWYGDSDGLESSSEYKFNNLISGDHRGINYYILSWDYNCGN